MKNIFKIQSFLKKICTPVNLSKIFVIFIIGITSRFLVNEYFDTNVFKEYWTIISLTYYSFFVVFIVVINEYFTLCNVNIIPNFIIDFFSNIGSLFSNKYIYNNINDPRNSNISSYYTSNYKNETPSSNPNEFDDSGYHSNIERGNPYYDNSIESPEQYSYQNIEDYYKAYGFHYNEQTGQYNYMSEKEHTPQPEQYARTEGSNRHYFLVDSLDENNYSREFNTPTPYSRTIPRTPEYTNYTTPSTMTPLFGSSENIDFNPSNQDSRSSLAYTNDTNHSTIGLNRSEDAINWAARRYNVIRGLEQQFVPPFELNTEEIRMDNPQIKGKIKLGIKYHNSKSNIHSLYIKYHDIAKRKFYWNIWEKDRNNYDTYEDFKKNFDPKTKIFKEIAKATKSDLSKEIQDLLKTDPFKTRRPTISTRNIGRIHVTNTQERLNNLHSSRHKSHSIPRRKK